MSYELIHGDCLDKMSLIPDGSIDMVLCDLPYGTTACKWDTIIPFEPLWAHYKRVIKKRGAVVLFGSEPFSSLLRVSNLRWYKYDWVWDKVTANGLLTKFRPVISHENISVFCKETPVYNPIKTLRNKPIRQKIRQPSQSRPLAYNDGEWRTYTDINPKSILIYQNRNGGGKLHPTQKPVPLLEYLIKTYTHEGELVLDNTMGSGSTGEACLRTNRNFIGIEKELNYFEIAKARLEKVESDLKRGITEPSKIKKKYDDKEQVELF